MVVSHLGRSFHGVFMFTVIRCRDLQRSTGKTDDINAYAKVGNKFFRDHYEGFVKNVTFA